MCGPAVAWDWLVLDLSYVLVLIGGGMTLRARNSSLVTWVWFGMLSATVGAILFAITWLTGPATAAAETTTSAVAMLEGC